LVDFNHPIYRSIINDNDNLSTLLGSGTLQTGDNATDILNPD
jgi:hypothetical protein